MAKVKLTAQKAAEKWSRNLGQAGQSIREGVEAVTENPAQKAIAQKDAWVAGIQECIQQGNWEKGLEKVTLDFWKTRFLEKGLPAITAGAAKATDKVAAFYKTFFPHLESAMDEVAAMPNVTLEDSIARVSHFMRKMASYRRS